MDDIKAGLQYAFQTENRLTLAVSGTGHAGMEVAMMNIAERGETILVANKGIWGTRMADLADRLGRFTLGLGVKMGVWRLRGETILVVITRASGVLGWQIWLTG